MPSSSGTAAPAHVPGAVPSAPDELSDLRLKLTWLTVFRTVATTLLLAATAIRLWSNLPEAQELSAADTFSFVLIGGVYALTLVYGLLLRRRVGGRAVAWVQVLGDVVIASALVYLTGGPESPFTFSYSLAVVGASILLFQRGALIAAGASSLAFATVAVMTQTQWVKSPLLAPPLPPTRLAFLLTSNVLAQFLIAALASYLSRQLSQSRGRLSAREKDIQELVGLQNQIVAAMPSGLITCEKNGAITFVNPAGAAILGVDLDDHRPRYIEDVLPAVMRLKPGTRRAELSVNTPAGKRQLGLAVTPLTGQSGALLIVFQDLTEFRRMEDELRQADHLASLGKFSAQLAHEIRNPLASMRGSAQMLASETARDPAVGRLATILIRESDRLSSLVEDFLKFARPGPPELKRLDLAALAAETVQMLRADPLARDIELDESYAQAWALADAAQLRQVLINLVRNAFAAVGARGRVSVTVQPTAEGARLLVWDSAGSIPASDLQRIFEPFYTTREHGTGLGLSTAHSIIAAHRGKIEVSSSKDAGTVFSVTLPNQPAAGVERSKEEPAVAHSDRR